MTTNNLKYNYEVSGKSEPTTLTELLPETEGGGTRFGAHFIMDWWTCPTKWFNKYIRPHPTKGGWGCNPAVTASPLWVGGLFHEGLEHWYRSGWQDGQYQIEAALTGAREKALSRKEEVFSEDIFERDWLLTEKLLRKYHDHYGPGGLDCDFPRIRVAADAAGLPLVEREFEIDLGYKDYRFTCKVDLGVHQDGYLRPMEHKTSAASGWQRLKQSMNMSVQPTGELFVFRSLFPDQQIDQVIVNIVIKDRSKQALGRGEPEFDRHPVVKRELDFVKFKGDIIQTLVNIEDSLTAYFELAEKWGVDDAARKVFTQHRQNCVSFRACDYYGPCMAPGLEETMFRSGFRPRAFEKAYDEKEDTLGD